MVKPEELETVLYRGEFHNRAEAARWRSVEAALETNETFDPVTAGRIRDFLDPNYLVGIGFGQILSHTKAFNPKSLQGIVCVDVSPEVIATGRAVRGLLKESDSPVDFVRLIHDDGALKSRLTGIEPEEGTPYVASILPKMFTMEDVGRVRKKPLIPFVRPYNPFQHPNPVPAMFLQNYELFRRLALEGRLGIIEGDITQQGLLRGIRDTLESYHTSNSLVYTSNAIDDTDGDKKLLVCRELQPSKGILLHKDAADYGFMTEYDGRTIRYRINRRDGAIERSISWLAQDLNLVINISATDAQKPKVEWHVRAGSSPSDAYVQMHVQGLMESFQRMEGYFGLSRHVVSR